MMNSTLLNLLVGSLGALASITSVAMGAPPTGVEFRLQVQGDAFALQIRQLYPAGVTLDAIRDVLLSGRYHPAVSDLIRGVAIQNVRGQRYEVRTTSQKYVTVTTINECELGGDAHSFRETCQLRVSGFLVSRLFVTGANVTHCWIDGGTVPPRPICQLTVTGQPKSIRIPIHRTAQQLLAAGAAESIHDTGALFLLLSDPAAMGEPTRAKALYEASLTAKLATRMYEAASGLPRDASAEFRASGVDGSFVASPIKPLPEVH